jgi:hypothetical protein
VCVSIDPSTLLRNALHIKQNVRVFSQKWQKKPKITLRDPGVQEAGMQNNCSGFKQQQESPMPESRHKKRAARKQPVHYPNNF